MTSNWPIDTTRCLHCYKCRRPFGSTPVVRFKMFVGNLLESSSVQLAGQSQVLVLYGGKTGDSLDTLRHVKYIHKLSSCTTTLQPNKLPPTSAAAQFHSLRTYHQEQEWMPSQPRQLYLGENTVRTPKILTCFVMLKLVHCQFKKHWQSVGKTKTDPKINDIIIIFPGRKTVYLNAKEGRNLLVYIYMYVDNKRDFTNPVVSSVMCHWLCPCYLRYHKQIILAVLECRTLI